MRLGQIGIRLVENYSEEDRLSLSGGESDSSQTDHYHLQWQPKVHNVLILEDGRTVSHAGLVKRTIKVGERPVQVAGIGGVLTRPDCRGRGFGEMAVQKAQELALEYMLVNFALLFCRPAMRIWYERLGWSPLLVQVWIDQPQGTIQAPLPTMVKCLSQETWPGGAVRIGCLPW